VEARAISRFPYVYQESGILMALWVSGPKLWQGANSFQESRLSSCKSFRRCAMCMGTFLPQILSPTISTGTVGESNNPELTLLSYRCRYCIQTLSFHGITSNLESCFSMQERKPQRWDSWFGNTGTRIPVREYRYENTGTRIPVREYRYENTGTSTHWHRKRCVSVACRPVFGR
jgi:hypothetical protein